MKNVIVNLLNLLGERLISRSQAKRIFRNLSQDFKCLMLDFKKVEAVGQGFVDEVFRVYQNQHPEVEISYVNANENVIFMVQRSLSQGFHS